MTPLEQIYNDKIEALNKVWKQVVIDVYKVAYNEAIDDAYKIASETTEYAAETLKLKKEQTMFGKTVDELEAERIKIWNEAIEAAARCVHNEQDREQIRKLKK